MLSFTNAKRASNWMSGTAAVAALKGFEMFQEMPIGTESGKKLTNPLTDSKLKKMQQSPLEGVVENTKPEYKHRDIKEKFKVPTLPRAPSAPMGQTSCRKQPLTPSNSFIAISKDTELIYEQTTILSL